MIDVKDIFVWYRDLPRVPDNFTAVQIEDWNREHAALFAKSFVGQAVTSCYGWVGDIDHDTIKAYGDYHLDYLVFHADGHHFHHAAKTSRRHYAQIQYLISYDEAQFRDTIRAIHKSQMIAFSGMVTDARWEVRGKVSPEDPGGMLFLELRLLSIGASNDTFLHAELLDENLRYRPKSSCFIATAAFESSEAPELCVLRQFRDDVLSPRRCGSIAIHLYEFASPQLASIIRTRPALRRGTKLFLTWFVVPIARRAVRRNGATESALDIDT